MKIRKTKAILIYVILITLFFSGCMVFGVNENSNVILENNNINNNENTNDTNLAKEDKNIDDVIITDENNVKELEEQEVYELPYIIKIDISQNIVFVFSSGKKEDNLIKSFSAGISKNLDKYVGKDIYLDAKKEWHTINENNYMKYASRINEEFYIGSSFHNSKDTNTLLLDSYRSIGERIDSFHVILTAQDAKWIYDNCEFGTKITVMDKIDINKELNISVPDLDGNKIYTDPTSETFNDEIDSDEYIIYIQKGTFTITIYKKGEEGQFNYPVKNYVTALGRTIGRTPSGEFEIIKKERWHAFPYPYDGGYTQYASYFLEKLMIHSPIYATKSINTMDPKLYNEIGGMKTAGCMRTTTEAAYWIYTYCPIGTKVIIADGVPKDIETPKLKAIDPEYPTTDPTDPFKEPEVDYPVSAYVQVSDGYTNSNVRKGPSTEYEIVGRILSGSKVTVIERVGEWYKINYNSNEAYIIGSYINISNDSFKEYSEKYYGMIKGEEYVDVRTLIDEIDIELVFSSVNNFTGEILYDHNIAFLQKETANKLAKAAHIFAEDGYVIKLYDAYRPYSVQEKLFELVNDPEFIADPAQKSHHNRGAAVDIALVDKEGKLLEFPSDVHTFNENSYSSNPNMTKEAKQNIDYMISVMEECGFYNYESEWWHFSDVEWSKYKATDYTYEDVILYN